MGQYYRPVMMTSVRLANGSEKKFCRVYSAQDFPAELAIGSRLTDHAHPGNPLVNSVIKFMLMAESPVRLFWMGDFGYDMPFKVDWQSNLDKYLPEAYAAAWGEYTAGACRAIPPYSAQFEPVRIVNEDRLEYIDVTSYPDSGVSPLPLLTAVGNGRGGGDYLGKGLEDVGRWAGDRLTARLADKTAATGLRKLVTEFGVRL